MWENCNFWTFEWTFGLFRFGELYSVLNIEFRIFTRAEILFFKIDQNEFSLVKTFNLCKILAPNPEIQGAMFLIKV